MNANIQKLLFKKAAELLSRRSFSRGDLREKLAKFGDGQQVELTLDRLEHLKLLNDEEYAYNFALCRIRQKGWGAAKVTDSLLKHNVEPDTIESALARIRREEGEESTLDRFVKKYCGERGLPSDLKDIKKISAYFRRRGYDEDDILRTLRKIVPGAELQRFETGE